MAGIRCGKNILHYHDGMRMSARLKRATKREEYLYTHENRLQSKRIWKEKRTNEKKKKK